MPSSRHETIREILASHPELLGELLGEARGGCLPEGADLQPIPAEAVPRNHPEHRADLVLVLRGADGKERQVFIVEVQLHPDDDKPYTWPHYAATLRARLRCPCDVVVVTPLAAVSSWAEKVVRVGLRHVFRPLVIGPRSIPRVTDRQEAMVRPELAVLSALAHGRDRRGAAVVGAAAWALRVVDEDLRVLYYDALRRAFSKENARLLEEAMRFKGIEFESDFARKYINIGREEGREEGRENGQVDTLVYSLLRVLKGRGLPVSGDQRDRIVACRDVDTLERWLDRSLHIDGVEELFH